MSNDDLRSIARDLAVYLRQQQDAGVAWFYDEAIASAAADSPPITASPESPEATEVAKMAKVTEVVRDAAQPTEDPFETVMTRFLAETLDQIRRVREQAPAVAESDLFAAASPDQPPPATREEKAAALAELDAEVTVCQDCKLHATRGRTVFGVGDPGAEIVFIGEAPGRNEDEQGEPFVGRAGKLLTDILKAIGFAREDVFICNILKCRPPGNRDPETDEVQACEPYLKRQLEILQPRVICCLGRHAAMTLLQTRASLKAMREAIHFYEGIPVIATFHPAALLRNPHWKRDTWDDVRKLRALYDALHLET